jgi:pimeloyl-ACP methyl ester carboxylesterase
MSPLTGLAQNLATWHVRRKRGALTDSTYPATGDILLYQSRGARIRDFIRARIDELADQEVIVLAHSLGGIASFELLVEERPANVTHLITFGSQAPFLYEIGALSTLEPGAVLPTHFPAWSNFYDLNDPLSYIGGGLFPGRVTDYPVESGESFPASHSAYLHARPFWQQLSALLRDA